MAPKSAPWTFVALAGLAGYCIFVPQVKSGYFEALMRHREENPTRLPGSTVGGSARTTFTGVRAVDAQLAAILGFFWPTLTGELPAVSLFSFWAAGQVLSGYAIMMLEGMRAGNRGRILAYTTIWGLIFQNIPFGIVMPIWAALYLWTSPVAAFSGPTTDRASYAAAIRIPDDELWAMPHALILGYVLPTVLMALPSPSVVTTDQQQIFIAVWQVFAILVAAVQFTLVRLFGSSSSSEAKTRTENHHALRLRWVYVFCVGVTFATHSLTIALALFSQLRPSWVTAGEGLDLAAVFWPPNPMGEIAPMKSFAESALALLQFDCYFGLGALLLLTTHLFRAVTSQPSMGAVLTGLAGPGGAALVLLWRRDERVLLRPVMPPKQKTG